MYQYKIRWIALLSLLLGGLICNPVSADIYLCIDEIKGEVTTSGFEDCIDIENFSDGVSRAISLAGGTRETGRPSFSEISMGKSMDKATVLLRQHAAVGTPLDMNIHFVNTGIERPCEYYHVNLGGALLASHTMSNTADQPFESLTINFSRITYASYTYDGERCGTNPVTWGYDLAAGQPL